MKAKPRSGAAARPAAGAPRAPVGVVVVRLAYAEGAADAHERREVVLAEGATHRFLQVGAVERF